MIYNALSTEKRNPSSGSSWLLPSPWFPMIRHAPGIGPQDPPHKTSHAIRRHHPHHHQDDAVKDRLFYAKCLVGGGLSSSVRWALTPLDYIKVSMQAHPNRFPNFAAGLTTVWRQEGMAGLYRGFTPTVLAYSTQSGVKYGLYEYLKDTIQHTLGPELSSEYKTVVYMVSAGTAEAIADVFMCPWEMLKVKVQTSSASGGVGVGRGSNAAASFPTQFRPALQQMIRQRHDLNFPFGSLAPLWSRQVVGTVANFVTFEHTVNAMYSYLLAQEKIGDDDDYDQDYDSRHSTSTNKKRSLRRKTCKDDFSTTTQLAVTFAAGYVSGFVSTVVSHPADSLLSLQARYPGWSYRDIIRHVGWRRLATRGLAPRVALTGTIIASQWLIYDSFKAVMGMGTSGGGCNDAYFDHDDGTIVPLSS